MMEPNSDIEAAQEDTKKLTPYLAIGAALVLPFLLLPLLISVLLFCVNNAPMPDEALAYCVSYFAWPLEQAGVDCVTSPFGLRIHPVSEEIDLHGGVDVAAAAGVDVCAVDAGIVTSSDFDSSYGNYVELAHGNGITTRYAHLSARCVEQGDAVTRGGVIGFVGSTGVSTGNHLHFEVRVDGTTYNPMQIFAPEEVLE